jgi:hypothetical protein
LKCAFNVAAAGDLLDEDGCQSLGPELLVDAEEVDFGAVENLVAYSHLYWDAGDECDELA